MKNTLRIDFEHNTIVMDRTFAKNCENTFSDEYRHLQKVRADYPEYNIITKIIRRNPNKDTYKGLTYDFMERYILSHGSKEEVATNLAVQNSVPRKRSSLSHNEKVVPGEVS